MVLPASGNSISLDQIHVELGEDSGGTVSLGDDDVRALASDTSGAIGMDQFFGLSNTFNIEDVFSTFLYTGNGSSQNIVNGVNVSGDGGMVWVKERSGGGGAPNIISDTVRGNTKIIQSDSNAAEYSGSTRITAFNNNGFSVGNSTHTNANSTPYTSWTWKKQTKFFDIVAYTGNGSVRTIAHSLGEVPGMIFIFRRDTNDNNIVWHRSLSADNKFILLNEANAEGTNGDLFNSTDPTDEVFTVGTETATNANGATYVAYLFGHQGNNNADAVISCGSYTGNGAALGALVDIGFEPQFVVTKARSASGSWHVFDNIRGLHGMNVMANIARGQTKTFTWNTQDEDEAANGGIQVNAKGFHPCGDEKNTNNATFIYMAIRRGPMGDPSAVTDVFLADTSPNSNNPRFISGFPLDLAFERRASGDQGGQNVTTRLGSMGNGTTTHNLLTGASGAASTSANKDTDYMNGFDDDGDSATNFTARMFRRYPGIMDVVTYEGDGQATHEINHSLGVAPEAIWLKAISKSEFWICTYPGPSDIGDYLLLNSDGGEATDTSYFKNFTPTSTIFKVNNNGLVNADNHQYQAILWATKAGFSKVGSVVVSGTTNVDCGFSSGARFVVAKRTDASGDWFMWDHENGINTGNDSYFLLNTNAAQVTNQDFIDPLNAGFTFSSNFTNGTYVFIAIA